jgi:hypothetical protein
MADRIAKNREIDQRVSQRILVEKKQPSEVASRSKAVKNALDKFQEIKRTQGLDAAAEFVRGRKA